MENKTQETKIQETETEQEDEVTEKWVFWKQSIM